MTKISRNASGVIVERRVRPALVPVDRRAQGVRLAGRLGIRA